MSWLVVLKFGSGNLKWAKLKSLLFFYLHMTLLLQKKKEINTMPLNIKKVTGEMEEFDIKKFKRSLTRPGASFSSVNKFLFFIKHIY